MAKSIFNEKAMPPTTEMIHEALGDNKILWNDIIQQLERLCGSETHAWKYYGKPWGWTMAFQSKKRTLMYLTPAVGFLYATFIFGEKAVAVARVEKLPSNVFEAIVSAKPTKQGRTFDIEIHSVQDFTTVIKLIDIKEIN